MLFVFLQHFVLHFIGSQEILDGFLFFLLKSFIAKSRDGIMEILLLWSKY